MTQPSQRTSHWIVGGTIIVYIVLLVGVAWFQYTHLMYDGYDLGIYDQVLWNTAHGRWFAYSFNPYSYLVDHREWMLLMGAAVYRFLPFPFLLLLFQAVAVGISAGIVYLLAGEVFQRHTHARWIALFCFTFFLLQPALHAMALFEFHALTFSLPLMLGLWLCVERKQWKCVWILWIIVLLLRDDIALSLIGVGVLLWWMYRKTLPQVANTALCMTGGSIAWLFLMQRLSAQLSAAAAPKFFTFYASFGETPAEVISYIMTHPLLTAQVLFQPDHLFALVMMVLPFLGLCFFAPRYLVPVALPLSVYLLIDRSISGALLTTHHAVVWLPWVYIASLYGYRALLTRTRLQRLSPLVLPVALICTTVFLNGVMGSWKTLAAEYSLVRGKDFATYQAITQQIGQTDAVMTSARGYPWLSQRERIYPTLHLWSGTEHYSQQAYQPPTHLDWVLLEHDEVLRYDQTFTPEERALAGQRLQTLIEQQQLQITQLTEDLIVWSREGTAFPYQPIAVATDALDHPADLVINNDIVLKGWEYQSSGTNGGIVLLQFEKGDATLPLTDQHLHIVWKDSAGTALKEKEIALGAGIQPTHTWRANTRYDVTIPLSMPTQTAELTLHIGQLHVKSSGRLAPSHVEVDPQQSVTYTIPVGESL